MHASLNHGRGEVMRAGHDIGDDLGLGGIWYGRLQHAHDGGRALAELHGLADDGRIAVEGGLPEAVREHGGASSMRAVMAYVEHAYHLRVQPHHFEIRAAHDSRANLAGIAYFDYRKADHREVAELAD